MTPSGVKKWVERPLTLRRTSALRSPGRTSLRSSRSRRTSSGDSSITVGASAADTDRSGVVTLLLSLQLGIERVAQTVAQEREADEGQRDRDGRERDEMGLGADVLLTLRDEAPPPRARRLDPDPDVREGRLREDRAWDPESDGDDDRSHPVGQ